MDIKCMLIILTGNVLALLSSLSLVLDRICYPVMLFMFMLVGIAYKHNARSLRVFSLTHRDQ